MCVRSDSYIVTPVQTKTRSEALWGIFLTLVSEVLWAFSEISIDDSLESYFPLTRYFVSFVLGNSTYIRFHQWEEFIEIIQRITIKWAWERHSTLWTDAVMLKCIEDIIGWSPLCKLAIAMQTDNLSSTIHVSLVCNKAFTEVISLTSFLQNLSLKVAKSRIIPARTRTILVLDTRDRYLFNDCENRLVRFNILILACCINVYRYQSE